MWLHAPFLAYIFEASVGHIIKAITDKDIDKTIKKMSENSRCAQIFLYSQQEFMILVSF
jgi:hypothetical protein